MKASKHPGKCKLCSKVKELTFEHVPPKKSFNSSTVLILPHDEAIKTLTDNERLPWDFSGLKGKFNQVGVGESAFLNMTITDSVISVIVDKKYCISLANIDYKVYNLYN